MASSNVVVGIYEMSNMCNITEEEDVDPKVTVFVIMEVVVMKTTMKREEKWTSKTTVGEVTITEEVVVQIVQMLNVTITTTMDTMQKIIMLIEKKVGKKIVKEDEMKDEGILMMANEGVIMDSDMVWYLALVLVIICVVTNTYLFIYKR